MDATKRTLGWCVVVAVAAWSTAASAVPSTLTQQGRILTVDGDVVSGEVTMVFTIYDAAEGGTALWSETQSLTLDDGYFSTALGEDTAVDSSLFDGSVRYLGVKVGADDEMTPRQAIRSMPYALHAAMAGHADTADHATTAAAAESLPFTGLTDIPPPCETAGQFLKGYDAAGAPQCVQPTLSCTNAEGSGTSLAFATCNDGWVVTGGSCYSSATITGSARSATRSYMCTVATATTVNATAVCCRIGG